MTGTTWAVEPSAAVITASASPIELAPEQLERHERLRRPQDRLDFVAARLLTQRLVAEVTGQSADDVQFSQQCDHCRGPHGRPYLACGDAPYISWSHAQGQVAAVVSPQPCGIDVEVVTDRRPVFDALTAAEQDLVRSAPEGRPQTIAFLRLWVRKEALLKAVGTGLTDQTSLARLDVRDDHLTYGGRHWHLTDLDTAEQLDTTKEAGRRVVAAVVEEEFR